MRLRLPGSSATRAIPRVVLIQAAHRLMNHAPHWSKFAAGLNKKGKPLNVAVPAVASSLLRRYRGRHASDLWRTV
ncbi:MAG: hypothetical protein ACK5Q5_09450 [Planctomycetaceae bacterium]